MRCPECSYVMEWNEKVVGFLCPQGCFAVYERARDEALPEQRSVNKMVVEYLEMMDSLQRR